MPRLDFTREQLGPARFAGLLKGVVVPRPIAWVSTVSAQGVENLAPHSFFTVASEDPPVVQFTSIGRKDSLGNAEATGEFVVCLASEPLFEQVNATGTNYPPGISEFEAVGLEREPSAAVRPPRVAASPVAIECRLVETIAVGHATIVLGEVIHIAVAEEVLRDGRPAIDLLNPLSRLGGNQWGLLGEIREIARIPYRGGSA